MAGGNTDFKGIKARHRLEDVVRQTLPLGKRTGKSGTNLSDSQHWGVCPFHADKNPSFHVDVKAQRFKCFGCGATGDLFDWLTKTQNTDLKGAVAILEGNNPVGAPSVPKVDLQAEPEAVYGYFDEQGTLLHQTVRFPGKHFRQRRPKKGKPDEWIWSLEATRTVLYRLAEVLEAIVAGKQVYIVEGEKDADRLRSEGLVATCNPMGAGSWTEDYSKMLKGANVVIWRDKDDPGRKHAATVKAALCGLAKSVDIVESLHGKDASDHFEAGGTLTDIVMIEEGRRSITLADMPDEIQDWLIYKWLPLGHLCMLVGYPGKGKTFGLCAIITILTRGMSISDVVPGFPRDPANPKPEPVDCIFVTAEDSMGATIKPRLKELGADLSRIHTFNTFDGFTPDALADVEALAREKNAKFICFDPWFAFLGATVDTGKQNQMRAINRLLMNIAARTNSVVIGNVHLNKSKSMTAADRVMGSMDMVAAPRSVLLLGVNPNDEDDRALIHVKYNLSSPAPSVGFTLREDEGWLWNGISDLTEGKALEERRTTESSNKRQGCGNWLKDYLKDGPESKDAIDLGAKEAGFGKDTLYKARDDLNIETQPERLKSGSRGRPRAFWALPGFNWESWHGDPFKDD